MSDSETKQFFIQKVLDQAKKQDIILSDVEKRMLSCQDTDPNLYENYELEQRFENEKLHMNNADAPRPLRTVYS